MPNNKIAVMGDKESVLAFKAVGADVYPTKNSFDAADTLKKLARTYSIIYITEDIALEITDIINRYKTRAYPIVIPIPGANGSKGYGMNNISKNVEKAIGTDILTKK